MREIKFRVWDINKKCWVKYLTYCIDDFSTTNKDWHIVMQYTGLKDKNGKEIYEGDIITDIYGFFIREVKYVFTSSRVGFDICNQLDYVILGNIYENPELINQQN